MTMTQIKHATETVWHYEDGTKIAHTRNSVITRCRNCGKLDVIDRCVICGSTEIDSYHKGPGNQRLFDLVRHQRGELFATDLVTCEEYALLACDHAAVDRLEDYDAIRLRMTVLQADLAEAREKLKRLVNYAGGQAGA